MPPLSPDAGLLAIRRSALMSDVFPDYLRDLLSMLGPVALRRCLAGKGFTMATS